MIHILQIGFSHNPGGVENCIMNYYRHIDKTKFSFDFLDLYGEGIAYKKEIITLGGKVIVLPNYKKYPITAAKKLYWLIKNSDYKIVHIHMQSAANLMPILAAIKSKKVKIIAHSHSSNTPKGLLRKSLNRVNIPIIRKLKIEKWACGYKAGLWMWGKSFDKCNIMENALEYENYKYNLTIRKRIRNECGFPESAKVIGFIGRFGEEKNTFFLIKVLKELVQLSSDFRLLTVGGNDLYNAFWDKLLEEGLKQYYYSAGIQGDTSYWYQAMDAFLLPSFFEGFPMVGVEAQATGVYCYFSHNISRETDLSGLVKYLPIGKNDEKIWANTIYSDLKNEKNIAKSNFPQEYKIDVATIRLEEKYKRLI